MPNLLIPHIKQSQETSCGAAALAMVYHYFGKRDQTEEVIWERLKVSRPTINNQYYLESFDLARDSSIQELSHFIGQAVLDSPELALQPIKEFLNLSIPVIVCQKISSNNELGHFRVVTNIKNDNIILNDPLKDDGNTLFSIQDFLSLWQKGNNGEVVGGQFIAIFNKDSITEMNKFTVFTFESSIKYFSATNLCFR